MSTSIFTPFGQAQQFSIDQPSVLERLTTRPYREDDLLPQIESNMRFLQKKLQMASSAIRSAVLIEPTVMHGNPVFRDTRIPIYQIVDELADGTQLEELTEGYPALTLDKIRNGLDFVSSLLRIYDEDISHR